MNMCLLYREERVREREGGAIVALSSRIEKRDPKKTTAKTEGLSLPVLYSL
jgi:hypothetical protein